MDVSNVGGPGTVQMMSLEGLDLESMLMAVQTNRVNLLDQQIKDQMVAVQDRNNRINALNVNMNGMNAALAKVGTSATESLAGFTAEFQAAAPQVVDTEATARMHTSWGMVGLAVGSKPDFIPLDGHIEGILEICNSNNIAVPDALKNYPQPSAGATEVALPAAEASLYRNLCATAYSAIKAKPVTKADPAAIACANRSQAEAYIKSQQSQIDALGNSQQQDMLRLQSLSNKRNEAFEIMTNFMKKLSDARASIIQKF